MARSRALFNGRDLSGFYSFLVDTRYDDPRRVFGVADGMLRVSGEGLGYLATREEFSDYLLRAEFRWGERNFGGRAGKARDAGIFLHAVGPDGNSFDGGGAFKSAIECQVMEGATGDLMLIRGARHDGKPMPLELSAEIAAERDAEGWPTWRAGGARGTLRTWGRLNWGAKDPGWRDVFGFRGARDLERRTGEWNRIECCCLGDRLEVRINGRLANRADGVVPRRGQILLQCEGSEILFRALEIERLAAGD